MTRSIGPAPTRRSFLTGLAGSAGLLFTPRFAHAVQPVAPFQLQVENQLDFDRPSEILDLSLDDLRLHTHLDLHSLVVLDQATGNRLLHQLYATSSTGAVDPDRLLILLDLPAHGSLTLTLHADPSATPLPSRVTARLVPERKDDFAWENDIVAFRAYGPALQAGGEISSGIDVWSKRVPDFVTRTWYERDRLAAQDPTQSYHRDNGQGLDSYDVGRSLGCGGTALWSDGTLLPSQNFASARILANGPIRTDFLLTYAPWSTPHLTHSEINRITLDAGSHLNRVRSTFFVSGGPSAVIAAGVAMHPGSDHKLDPEQSTIAVWDTPQLASAGHIATAVLCPGIAPHPAGQSVVKGGKPLNAFLCFDVKDGDTIEYATGAAWSQADIPTFDDWLTYLKHYRERTLNPLIPATPVARLTAPSRSRRA